MLGYAAFRSDTMDFYRYVLRDQSISGLWQNPPWMLMIPLNETLPLLMVKIGLPSTPFVTRVPFALLGIFAVFFVWKFAKRWFSPGVALFVLCLAVFNPYQLYHSRDAYHYSGVICWSAALFLAFWSIKETLQRNEAPAKKQWVLWFSVAALACYMHMSVWVAVALQALLIFTFGWIKLRAIDKKLRSRFFFHFFVGATSLSVVMSRWVFRAAVEVLNISKGSSPNYIGLSAKAEFLRLIPAYFVGENIFAVALLLIFITLAVLALFGRSEISSRYRSLAWISILHVGVLMIYMAGVSKGLAKISYFSTVWPQVILTIGVGSFLGVQMFASKGVRAGLYALLIGSYVGLSAWPAYAIIHLDGHPTPFYKINAWVLKNLPEGTPILTDRWLEPWNELAIHNPGNINYTFTVPNEPIETYRQLNWRKTAEQFFEKYPEAALLEVCRGQYEEELGLWTFPQHYFSRIASITNDAAMILFRMKVVPQAGFSDANTNRVVTRIFYNTTEDLIAAARTNGKDVLRLYGAGWGYAKPGWQQGRFEDYRILTRAAAIEFYNLKEAPLSGALEISAATADKPKTISVNGVTTGFASGRIRTWTVPLILQVGKNTIPFASPSADPLFVLDIRWKPQP
jgi:hypothetical protein